MLHHITTKSYPIEAGLTIGSHPGGQMSFSIAVIEAQDGALHDVSISDIMMLDTRQQLKEFEKPKEQKISTENEFGDAILAASKAFIKQANKIGYQADILEFSIEDKSGHVEVSLCFGAVERGDKNG